MALMRSQGDTQRRYQEDISERHFLDIPKPKVPKVHAPLSDGETGCRQKASKTKG
jgi:hypothetical protein